LLLGRLAWRVRSSRRKHSAAAVETAGEPRPGSQGNPVDAWLGRVERGEAEDSANDREP